MLLGPLLHSLVARYPDVLRALIFCDDEGERVCAAKNDPSLADYDVDAFGAVYGSVAKQLPLGTDRFRARTEKGLVLLRTLGAGYYVVAFCAVPYVSDAFNDDFDTVVNALLETL